jgi:WD40 repeat protein/heme exporter protein D
MDEAPKPPDADEEKHPLHQPPEGPAVAAEGLTVTLSPEPQEGASPLGVAPDIPSLNLPWLYRDRYVPQGLVAQGGQGRILRAEDPRLGRVVALKELLEHGGVSEERFLREARITARLQHPSIIPIYEAGRWPGGEPFYAMKLVSDRSLAQLIESMRTLEERLGALPHVLAVAEAMAYAHSQRVIHRDLKPSNILVGEFGETVVIDWGLAKELHRSEPALDTPGTSQSPQPQDTQLGTVMGTPSYMPPEQAAGQPVDERADVYALGAILYHLLSGQAPYAGANGRQVLEHVLSTQPLALARLQPGLPEELLTIVSRAMERDPARRYPTARELAEDLRRFQTGQLVGSHHYTPWKLLWRFARRHWVPFCVTAAALALLVLMGVANHRDIVTERQLAEQQRDQARQQRDRAEQQQALAEQAQRKATQHADQLTLEQARELTARAPETALARLDALSDSFAEWGQMRTLAAEALAQGIPRLFRDHTASISYVDYSPDGRWLVSASDDHTVRLWEVSSGTSRVLETFGDEVWRSIFSPDGRFVASASKNGQVRLWERATSTSRTLKGHTASVSPMRFSPDGRHLYSLDIEGQLWRWDVTSGAGQLLGTHDQGSADLVLLSGGRQLLSGGLRDKTVRLWDTADGSSRILARVAQPVTALTAATADSSFAVSTSGGQVLLWRSARAREQLLDSGLGTINSLMLSPDGRYLAAASAAGPIRLWDLKHGTAQLLPSTRGWRASLTFSRESRWLVSGGRDGHVRLWDLATGSFRLLHKGGSLVSFSVFSPDGQWLATSNDDGVLRLHQVEQPYARLITRHEGAAQEKSVPLDAPYLRLADAKELLGSAVQALASTPDGRYVLSAGIKDSQVRISTLEGEPVTSMRAHPEGITAAFALPDGTRLVTAGSTGTVALWDGTGRQLQRLSGPAHRIQRVSVSADGTWVAAGDASGAVWRWEVASGRGHALGDHGGSVLALAFSPDGRTLASACLGGEVRLWEMAGGTGRLVHQHRLSAVTLSFSADGQYLASGSEDHTVWVQTLASGQAEQLAIGEAGVTEVRFSPDSQTLFIASLGTSEVKRWEVRTRGFLAPLRGHSGFVTQLAFSPEGQRLATASADGSVRLWDLHSGESRALRGHEGAAVQVAFTRDGRHVLSAGLDGTVRLWVDDLPLELAALRARVRQAVNQ